MPNPKPSRAEVNADSPQGWSTCDQCGWQTNLNKMSWEKQWYGPTLRNTGFLLCQVCNEKSKPAPFLQTLILPPDPPPLMNARPENYDADENSYRALQDDDIRITQTDGIRIVQIADEELLFPPNPPPAVPVVTLNFSIPLNSQMLPVIGA